MGKLAFFLALALTIVGHGSNGVNGNKLYFIHVSYQTNLLSLAAFKFAPFYDTFLQNRTSILEFFEATGQKDYHIAFALGGFEPCVPTWGGQ